MRIDTNESLISYDQERQENNQENKSDIKKEIKRIKRKAVDWKIGKEGMTCILSITEKQTME